MSTTYRIYPSIGIARVGNSPQGFYIGPETSGGLPENLDGRPFTAEDFRDEQELLKRQAARFRIFKYVDGVYQEEVTLHSDGVNHIEWRAHIANKKSSWYEFDTLNGEQGYSSNHVLRNHQVTGTSNRQRLNIDPGPRELTARQDNTAIAQVCFDRPSVPCGYPATFPPPLINRAGEPSFEIDNLGEMHLDDDGNLLLLGGFGKAGTTDEQPALPAYANNDNWWDDTADGPVSATIVLDDGTTLAVDSAWVLVAPPAYAPQIENLVTLYDTIYDVAVRKQEARPDMFNDGLWNKGEQGFRPNFVRDIKPILARGEHYPAVVAIPPKPHRFDWQMLGDPDEKYNGYRQYFLDVLRGPQLANGNTIINDKGATMMPYLAGDDAINEIGKATELYLTLTQTQYFMLSQWAQGIFDCEPVTDTDRGTELDRGVLDNCVGGAFSPGIEMTWISRNSSIYQAPFRVRVAELSPDTPLSLGFDPIKGMEPGDVTRYMALPWLADFNECSSQPIGSRVLWWWPAQRPAMVHVVNPFKSEERIQIPWVGTDFDQNADDYVMFSDNVEMVHQWSKLGFIYNIGSSDMPDFVEVSRTLKRRELEEIEAVMATRKQLKDSEYEGS